WRQQTSLLRLAYLISGDLGVAEDAVAEAFARVWPRWLAGQVEDPGPYLGRAGGNELLRGRGGRARGGGWPERRRGDDRGGGAVAEQVADHETLWRALQALPTS